MRFAKLTPALGAGALSVAIAVAAIPARAIPPPQPPEGKPTPEPTATPFLGAVFPAGSTLLFVLDEKVSSASTPDGAVIKIHLKDPLIVNDTVIAPAGTPGTFTVVSTRKSASGDQDGAIQVHFDALQLPQGGALPVRAFHEYLTIDRSAGQLTTRSALDTLGDIFVPYYLFYGLTRKGQQYVLPPGSVLRAQTAATLDATDPKAVAVRTPAPFVLNNDPVHADYTPVPLYTYVPTPPPKKKTKPTAAPTAAPAETSVPQTSVTTSPSPLPSAT